MYFRIVAIYEKSQFQCSCEMGENNLTELLGYFSLEVIIPQCQVQKMKSNELFSRKAIATRALL